MAKTETEIRLRVGFVRVTIGLQIWHAPDGSGIVALDAKDRRSQEFLERERSAINEKIAEKYDLKQTYTYERDPEDGYYVPQEGSKSLAQGIPMPIYLLQAVGRQFQRGLDVTQGEGFGPCR